MKSDAWQQAFYHLTFQKTVNKYGKESINLTGHSLGSGQALYIGEKFDIPSHNFNGAVSVNQVLDEQTGYYSRCK